MGRGLMVGIGSAVAVVVVLVIVVGSSSTPSRSDPRRSRMASGSAAWTSGAWSGAAARAQGPARVASRARTSGDQVTLPINALRPATSERRAWRSSSM